jgi:hypothetical protein
MEEPPLTVEFDDPVSRMTACHFPVVADEVVSGRRAVTRT